MDMADEHDADYRSWEEAVRREAVISDLVGRHPDRNRCEPNTVTILPARYPISCGRVSRSGAAAVSCGCPEVSNGCDSARNFAVRVKARQLGERT